MRVGVVHAVSGAKCEHCSKEWVAAFETDFIEWHDKKLEIKMPNELECPSCGKMTKFEDESDW